MAIGVPFENMFDSNDNRFRDVGAINVIYGASAGLSAAAKADQVWHQNIGSVEGTIGEPDNFGYALASG